MTVFGDSGKCHGGGSLSPLKNDLETPHIDIHNTWTLLVVWFGGQVGTSLVVSSKSRLGLGSPTAVCRWSGRRARAAASRLYLIIDLDTGPGEILHTTVSSQIPTTSLLLPFEDTFEKDTVEKSQTNATNTNWCSFHLKKPTLVELSGKTKPCYEFSIW